MFLVCIPPCNRQRLRAIIVVSMSSLQCLDSIGFALLLKPHFVGGSYATLAAVAAQMNRCCELCPAELTMFRVSDLVHTFYA